MLYMRGSHVTPHIVILYNVDVRYIKNFSILSFNLLKFQLQLVDFFLFEQASKTVNFNFKLNFGN
jgi:hypothetical protein